MHRMICKRRNPAGKVDLYKFKHLFSYRLGCFYSFSASNNVLQDSQKLLDVYFHKCQELISITRRFYFTKKNYVALRKLHRRLCGHRSTSAVSSSRSFSLQNLDTTFFIHSNDFCSTLTIIFFLEPSTDAVNSSSSREACAILFIASVQQE